MSRFPIRVQVLLLTAVFILSLLAVGTLSLTTNQKTTSEFRDFQDAVRQIESLNAIKEDIEQGTGDLLAFAGGSDPAHSRLMDNIDEILTEIDRAPEIFLQTNSEWGRMPETVEALMTLRVTAEELQERAAGIESLLAIYRKNPVDSEIVPLFDTLRDGVNVLQDGAKERLEGITKESLQFLDTASVTLMAATGVVVALALGVAFLFGHLLSAPVRRAAAAVQGLADGDYASEISGGERRDEIGHIAQKLVALRDQLSDADAAQKRVDEENAQRIDLFQALGSAMSKLKSGALSSRIEAGDWRELGDSYVKLCENFNGLAEGLESLVGSLRQSAETVERNAGDLSEMSNDMSRRAEVQAATLEESAAALDELSESVQSAAVQAKSADEKVVEGRRRAEEGRGVMQQAMEAMASIAKSSEQITQIIDVIDDIAFQTNLLALNAGVEAARAGESGKGFAVVASEVRGLAQRAAESASEIKDLVLNSTQQVEDGEALVQQTGDSLGLIVESVSEVSDMVSAIARSAQEQASGVQEINVGVAELDKVTQQNAAMVTETTAASNQLNSEATRLTELLSAFSGSKANVARKPTAAPEVKARPAPSLETDTETAGSRDSARAEVVPAPGKSEPSREDLLHGGWADEMPEPEPMPMPSMRKASGDETDWADF